MVVVTPVGGGQGPGSTARDGGPSEAVPESRTGRWGVWVRVRDTRPGWRGTRRPLARQTGPRSQGQSCLLKSRAWTDRKGESLTPGGAAGREAQERARRRPTCRRAAGPRPPHLTAVLCNVLTSTGRSRRLGDRRGVRPHLTRVTRASGTHSQNVPAGADPDHALQSPPTSRPAAPTSFGGTAGHAHCSRTCRSTLSRRTHSHTLPVCWALTTPGFVFVIASNLGTRPRKINGKAQATTVFTATLQIVKPHQH